jgi:HEAT repeat protein
MLRGARHIREGGPEAAKFLIAAAESPDPEDRCAAIALLMNETDTLLGESGCLDFGPHRARAAEVLAKRLLDDEAGAPFDEMIPYLAINALAGLGEEGLKPLADAAASHPKETVRERARAALETLRTVLKARKEAAQRKATAQPKEVAQPSDEMPQTDEGGWSANQYGLVVAAAFLYVMFVVTVFRYRKFRRERAAKPH